MQPLQYLPLALFLGGAILLLISSVLLAVLSKDGARPIDYGSAAYRKLNKFLEPRHVGVVRWTALTGATLCAIAAASFAIVAAMGVN